MKSELETAETLGMKWQKRAEKFNNRWIAHESEANIWDGGARINRSTLLVKLTKQLDEETFDENELACENQVEQEQNKEQVAQKEAEHQQERARDEMRSIWERDLCVCLCLYLYL